MALRAVPRSRLAPFRKVAKGRKAPTEGEDANRQTRARRILPALVIRVDIVNCISTGHCRSMPRVAELWSKVICFQFSQEERCNGLASDL